MWKLPFWRAARTSSDSGHAGPSQEKPVLLRRFDSRVRLVVLQVFLLFGAFFLLRLILALAFAPTSPVSLLDYVRAFFVGFHFDLAVAITIMTPAAVWCLLAPSSWWRARFHRI